MHKFAYDSSNHGRNGDSCSYNVANDFADSKPSLKKSILRKQCIEKYIRFGAKSLGLTSLLYLFLSVWFYIRRSNSELQFPRM